MNNIRFEEWKTEQFKDPEFRAALEELEAANLVTRLRLKRGMTQAQLAEAVGTKQSSITRLESGASQPRLSFLRRVLEALGGKLELNVVDLKEDTEQIKIQPTLSTNTQAVSVYAVIQQIGQFEQSEPYRFYWINSPESPTPQRVVL